MIGRGRVLHSLVFLGAVPAIEQAPCKPLPGFAFLDFASALIADEVPRRANTGQVHRIELELTGWDDVFH
ncbi:MAG: hypothetical protein AWU57_3635 [Marinobacter sp. T13-3]|nr:MAG: hypothetical protein AWU57_3635 [Marinobacter sp. T13-3]